MKSRIAQRIRSRRDRQVFQRALENAEPSMRQELLAIATRSNGVNR